MLPLSKDQGFDALKIILRKRTFNKRVFLIFVLLNRSGWGVLELIAPYPKLNEKYAFFFTFILAAYCLPECS
jgi:hypothetical protein